MLTYYLHRIPGDETGCREVFEFARKMGIETLISEPLPEALDTIEKFCDQYDIRLALHNHDQKSSPDYWNPQGVLKACQTRSKRVGACGDVGYWLRSGIDPVQAIQLLGERLITLELHDVNELSAAGHDVPWGSGAGRTAEVLAALRQLPNPPVMIGLEYSYDFLDSLPEMKQCIEFFNRTSLELSPNSN